VIVFARAPLAGRAKTRLAPRLGAAGAARLQARLIRAALRTAELARCGPVELHLDSKHSMFDAPLQRGRDLGERMRHALERALQRHARAILIGSDCPELEPADLRRARRWLDGGTDVVLAPAEDGGYALIAARRLRPHIFAGVEWSSASVFSRTVKNLERAGLRWRALRTVRDVDRPADLDALRSLRFSSASRRGARR
jgi:rSAM/selenodomain-associated transferase 1